MYAKRIGVLALAGMITITVVTGLIPLLWESAPLCAKPPANRYSYFDVSVSGDMLLLGVFDSEGAIIPSDTAFGAAGTTVVVAQPSPVIGLDFLGEDEEARSQFLSPYVYSVDGLGALQIIQDGKKPPVVKYYFRDFAEDGSLVHYVLEADAVILPDNPGSSFPHGDPDGYTVYAYDFHVWEDGSGNRRNRFAKTFWGTTAEIRLDRLP